MRTIYKYEIPFCDEPTIQMPKDASILKFGTQGEQIHGQPHFYVWALVDTDAEMEERKFRIFGTGHELPDDCMKYGGGIEFDYDFEYFDTLFERGFVWHIFVGCKHP